jgi:hypothetical protein
MVKMISCDFVLDQFRFRIVNKEEPKRDKVIDTCTSERLDRLETKFPGRKLTKQLHSNLPSSN